MALRRRFRNVLASHPRCVDLDVVRIERHEVGAIAGSDAAERVAEAEKAAGSAEAKRNAWVSGTPSSSTQLRTAVAMSRCAPASVPSARVQRPLRNGIASP